jgi:hypothetical protein
MKNLIGISGKINSGKDTVGKIIQILADYPKMSTNEVVKNLNKELYNTRYEIKKFADKLKDCACLIIGCTRAQLEDREFKEAPLGPEWDYYRVTSSYGGPDEIHFNEGFTHGVKENMTPRRLLQLLGTDAGRNIIHPNIWVNATFADYKHSKWLFTDMRFPNELVSIQDRDGLTIRVSRPYTNGLQTALHQHESETALDNAGFNHVIKNNGTIEELIEKVREIMKVENII